MVMAHEVVDWADGVHIMGRWKDLGFTEVSMQGIKGLEQLQLVWIRRWEQES